MPHSLNSLPRSNDNQCAIAPSAGTGKRGGLARLMLASFGFSVIWALMWSHIQAFVISSTGPAYISHLFIMLTCSGLIGSYFLLAPLRSWTASRQGLAASLVSAVCLGLLLVPPTGSSLDFALRLAVEAMLIGAFLSIAMEKVRVVLSHAVSYAELQAAESRIAAVETIGSVVAGIGLAALSSRLPLAALVVISLVILLALVPAYFGAFHQEQEAVAAEAAVEAGAGEDPAVDSLSLKSISGQLSLSVAILYGLNLLLSLIFGYVFLLAVSGRFTDGGEINAFIGWYYIILGVSTLLFLYAVRPFMIRWLGLSGSFFTSFAIVGLGLVAMIFSPSFMPAIVSVFLMNLFFLIGRYVALVGLQLLDRERCNLAWSWISGPLNNSLSLGVAACSAIFTVAIWGSTERALWALAWLLLVLVVVTLWSVRGFSRAVFAEVIANLGGSDSGRRARTREFVANRGVKVARVLAALRRVLEEPDIEVGRREIVSGSIAELEALVDKDASKK
ncbi:MAG: hypothetical protein WCT10_06050 [Patescibacteria group bacterium]|jgi:hypothetical protein